MPTDKKHIAVYLSPDNERDLESYCKDRGLKYSAAVNEILSMFFGGSGNPTSNISIRIGNILGLEERLRDLQNRLQRLERER